MKRKQLGLELAREQHIPRGAAQDEVDELVAGIIRKLRAGETVKLPGMGSLVPKPEDSSKPVHDKSGGTSATKSRDAGNARDQRKASGRKSSDSER